MERMCLVLAIIGLFVIGCPVIPHIAYADCGSSRVDCCVNADRSKTIATTTFSMCWSWKHFQCRPCHGGGQWSYFAAWCNSTYQECGNHCRGCSDAGNCCIDQQGNMQNCEHWDWR